MKLLPPRQPGKYRKLTTSWSRDSQTETMAGTTAVIGKLLEAQYAKSEILKPQEGTQS